ncbi:MAG: hypothetical protein HY770_06615, partial [Chitinivibrionia bacterium]|nr:hypothetical protein [Chitinivibrionia bacterium]
CAMSFVAGLSDNELLASTLKLRRREHKTTLEILDHLNEIERRRLHLKLGYSSLFDYCTRHLKYSASAAGRRVQAAKCVRRYPEVYELLEKEKVNLMTVALVAGILNDGNRHEVLGAIQEKTQREVEAIASRYRPPVALRDRVSHVRVCVPDRSLSHGGL